MESLRGLSSSPASAYDELVTSQKSIRYHWQGILSVIRALPGGGLRERVESARRQLEESGATVNLLDDRGTPGWSFDPLPLVIAPDEWVQLEAGLIQRANLLDGLLADLYGPQKLLAEHLVPPMLVHANRHFLRACRVTDGAAPARHLGQYAVDLVRLGDGRWHVLADHTEVPSGIGYALEMRRVLARSLPEAFRSIPVRHLRPFVDRWHYSLAAMAPHDVANPNMAVLTPGSLSATYFEHVYLARTLGVPLVEGGDLVARDGEVALKTLAGLRPVHMLLRRLDSAFVDPLELRADSALGVTGLVEATRSGRIELANALGSGVVALPPIASQVWVEFEAGDPDYPIWTGAFWSDPAGFPPLALVGATPATPNIHLQTTTGVSITLSDNPAQNVLIKTLTGAMVMIGAAGITIMNGQGASIAMVGPSVVINNGALTIT